ncbi:type VI secretion system-associated protein TagF [Roseomonas frigidaquae]|uniref:Type VI secretion system-associated protein TagF n=1 Tax=Falsiroseomonas frigidaquae TaxID=487318 RepID=A0ABX1F3R5_9PROT|nr:type VI secretion system-associated protein TagF [Falsiroseomonas frigidaquae]NKE46919.1 type VI secretion system-associated protein TagF [Falsiroseomonas frigidaquae]
MPTGFLGKLPAHGDFLRRALPEDFAVPWDDWLQAGLAALREGLDDTAFAAAWDATPAWRFLLPAGACGASRVAGVILPSEDLVGRRYPLTLAALLPPASPAPAEAWFDSLQEAGQQARALGQDADALLAALPEPWAAETSPEEGWWLTPEHHWPLPALPPPMLFRVLVEGGG